MNVDTYFIAAVGEDGRITTMPEMPEAGIEAARPVTNYDVYQTAKQIVDEFESSVLAQKVAEVVVSMMNPVEPTTADKIQEALKKRGFETASE
jgi:methylmalonyl-CoA mutase cobalamin-binding subunit